MRATWSEPYLWVHLAGLAAVPIFLELCLLGLAASTAHLPAQLVLLLVAAAGIAPIAWMQWQRPFSVFSLLLLAVKPKNLTEFQRQVLQRFTVPIGKVVTVLTAGFAAVLLWQVSRWVPLVSPAKVALLPAGALGGLLLAMVAFLLVNLFLQVPVTVLTVMLTPDVLVRNAVPYPVDKIAQDFTLIGVPVQRILPRLVTESIPPMAAPQPKPSTPTKPRSDDWDEALAFEQDQTTGQIDAVSLEDAEAIADATTFVEPVALDGVAEAAIEPVASAAETDPLISVEADEGDWIESSVGTSDQPQTDPEAELTEADFSEVDASEAEWITSTEDEADSAEIGAEVSDEPESVNPFSTDLTASDLTESVEPVQAEPAHKFTDLPAVEDWQPAHDHSAANGQTALSEETSASVTPFYPEALAEQPSPFLARTRVSPNAADVVVRIVPTDSAQAASDQALAEVAEPMAAKPALTVAETVVKIILS